MSRSDLMPVFDGHNDVLLRLIRGKTHPERDFLEGDNLGHLDLPRMKKGGFVGGFFAVYVSSQGTGPDIDDMMAKPQYDIPLPRGARALTEPAGDGSYVRPVAAHRTRLEGCGQNLHARLPTFATCIQNGTLATILHIEGAEGIDPDFFMLDVLYGSGLRSVGPVWSRSNIFGHGVPFRYPVRS